MDEFLLFVQESMGGADQMVYRHMETEESFQPYFLNLSSSSSLGTPLQYSCLENPMDGGAWWAAVHGVARVGYD